VTARERFRADLDRYVEASHDPHGFARRLRIVLFCEGVWAIAMYRFGQYLYEEAPKPLRALLRIPYELARKILVLVVGIHLSPETRVGPGLYIAHFGGIWINPRAVLGAHCNIAHGVTIGAPDAEPSAPVLGDRVWIGPGAVITGPIRIGSRVVIGANSLVSSNLPDSAVAVGVPARVLAHTGSDRLMRRGKPEELPPGGDLRLEAGAGPAAPASAGSATPEASAAEVRRPS
jgi:serine O-acetyltransferase